MPLFGTISIWTTLFAAIASICLYLFGGVRGAKWGRVAFFVAAAGIFAAAATLGDLLVTHRFDVAYVYQHSARGMASLFVLPSFWSGQEGSFLLWAFWISVLGIVLALTSRNAERRVMPIYTSVLLFLAVILTMRSPFIPLDTMGQPVPTDGLGLDPNLENYWMVIHPPTLFLGFSTLTIPFSFALSALFWRDWDGWLRRALPWGLFGFAVLGLAMMMGGYWAYEMLGWGGFWEWDPVENGPFVPWIALVAFLHAAQIQRVRGGFLKPTLFLGLLPFVGAMYESFMTRSGVLANFSVHSFSTLGGNANGVLLAGLLLALVVSMGTLIFRLRELKAIVNTWESAGSREFGYTMSILLMLTTGLIAVVGMSAPLITGAAVHFGWMAHTASVQEDFYNKAMFPLAIALAIGLGIGPLLAWRGRGKTDFNGIGGFYLVAVVMTIGFVFVERALGTPLSGLRLVPELLLFAAAAFALVSNGVLMVQRFRPSRKIPIGAEDADVATASRVPRVWTIGGTLSHIGAAVFLIGLVGLVTFVRKDTDRLMVKNLPTQVLNGAYTITYIGQTGDYRTDRNNDVRFLVVPRSGKHSFIASMPFAMRALDTGQIKLFAHPAISHHLTGDLYLSLKEGPDEFYPSGHTPVTIKLGAVQQWGDYTLQFVKFQRDPQAAALAMAGFMPPKFPVWADVRVTIHGHSFLVKPESITLREDPSDPVSPEITLPGGAILSFIGMNAGSANAANPDAGAMNESGQFQIRQPGPVMEAFEIDVTTRPLIDFIWLGTLLIFGGGLVSMRRRILENRESPIPDAAAQPHAGRDRRKVPSVPGAKRRTPAAQPSLATRPEGP